MTVFRTPDRTSVRTRRYAPKGSRVVTPAPQTGQPQHVFVPQRVDPVSCFWCNLARANGRHS